ncbi:hypothetical protein EDD21DRAFT_358778 [Dissophora ornata]|nr:hypothetical protein EDD21DRAFT_358778 [Dissophora ornata]
MKSDFSVCAFPRGLAYQQPRPLVSSSGVSWEYQASEELLESLPIGFREHFRDFQSGQHDKIYMPLYLFLSGAGTGKSRNASEFHLTALRCLADGDEGLKSRLQNAVVFHDSLENGTALRD